MVGTSWKLALAITLDKWELLWRHDLMIKKKTSWMWTRGFSWKHFLVCNVLVRMSASSQNVNIWDVINSARRQGTIYRLERIFRKPHVIKLITKLFQDGDSYHIENSSANQWTGTYMITVSVMKELTHQKVSSV